MSNEFDTKSFATMSERRFKDNPHINGTHIIGLDMGYSGPKCFHEKGNFIFPNFCQKITGEIFGDLNKTDYVYEDLSTGERYYVGELATKLLSEDSMVAEDSLFGRNHYLHPDFLITFRTALGLATWDLNSDGSDLFIQTGLPPAYISQDEVYLRQVFEKEHHFAITAGKERKEFSITLKADQIDVMYQPMGAFYSVVIDNEGKISNNITSYMNSDLLVFDGGFGTLDKFVVKGKQLKEKDTNANLGMKRVLEETRNLIEKKYGTTVSIPAMQGYLKSGAVKVIDRINLKVEQYPINECLKKANEIVREEAFESIKDYVFDIKYLIMAGGTGIAWYPYFKERLKDIPLEVIAGNQNSNLPGVYSNARGYYMYRLNQLKAKR